jgi:chromate transporter
VDQIPAIARVFAYLSLLTVGGGMAAFPAMKDEVIDVHQWLTFGQLIHLYSVGQMAPGPNMMMVASVGERVAGITGAMVAALAFFVPTGILTFIVGNIWEKLKSWPWKVSIQNGLAPVAVGLAVAGTITLGRGAVTGWLTAVVALAVFFATLKTKINPALYMLGGALIGVAAPR